MAPPGQRPRRHDPDRRQRIVDAALRVVGARGIDGLSHRTVAAEADVPLGSTTYHFSSLDELLVAALRQANEGFGRALRESDVLADVAAPPADPATAATDPATDATDRVAAATELAAALARLMGEWIGGERTGVELEYELYLAALRRPALRPVVAEWTDAVAEALSRRTDPVTARALGALMDGIFLQVLLTDGTYDEEYARTMLTRLLAPTEPPNRPPLTSSDSPDTSTDT
ncbi:TetR/AcrR family transcriptional regulator [Streptomyces sp. NPDC015346]|uniref:TetR/AcrR family transcriptional regulator n=1 Tax=Streptomyces sp. NPDC015346 TaxID=3364954 RepID=UPI0036FE53FF